MGYIRVLTHLRVLTIDPNFLGHPGMFSFLDGVQTKQNTPEGVTLSPLDGETAGKLRNGYQEMTSLENLYLPSKMASFLGIYMLNFRSKKTYEYFIQRWTSMMFHRRCPIILVTKFYFNQPIFSPHKKIKVNPLPTFGEKKKKTGALKRTIFTIRRYIDSIRGPHFPAIAMWSLIPKCNKSTQQTSFLSEGDLFSRHMMVWTIWTENLENFANVWWEETWPHNVQFSKQLIIWYLKKKHGTWTLICAYLAALFSLGIGANLHFFPWKSCLATNLKMVLNRLDDDKPLLIKNAGFMGM